MILSANIARLEKVRKGTEAKKPEVEGLSFAFTQKHEHLTKEVGDIAHLLKIDAIIK